LKRLRIVLAATFAVAVLMFAACASNDNGSGSSGETGATTGGASGATTGTSGASGGSGEIPAVTTLEDGVLQVGSCLDYPPFETVKGGQEQGFDVDITDEIARRLGLEVKWVRADFDTIFTAVSAGQFDMVAAASTITAKREQTVDFSDPYFNSRQALVVNTEQTPDIKTTDDLQSGDVVAVQKGTTGADWVEENLVPKGIQEQTFTSATDALRALEGGGMTAVVADEPFVGAATQDLPSLSVVQGIDTDEKYGLAFSPDNPGLRDAANAALAEMIADGTYEQIFQKWFPGVETPPEFAPSA
jgi:polar amino acid transport system substrate-binding protein